MLLTEKDIASVIQYNHTFARRPKDYKRILWNLLRESAIYKKGQEHAYDMLFNFLNKTYMGETLATKRRVGFAVAPIGEKLPDVAETVRDFVIRKTAGEEGSRIQK